MQMIETRGIVTGKQSVNAEIIQFPSRDTKKHVYQNMSDAIIATNLEDFGDLYRDRTGLHFPLGKYAADLFDKIELDDSTRVHSVRVASLALHLGNKVMHSSTIGPLDIAAAAILHDVGKAGKREIVEAPRRLTPKELDVMNQHPIDGAKILIEHPISPKVDKKGDLRRKVVAVAVGHHIHKYPKQQEIMQNGLGTMLRYIGKTSATPESRLNKLVSVADIFDAIWFPRAYTATIGGEPKKLPSMDVVIDAVNSELTGGNKKPLPYFMSTMVDASTKELKDIEPQLEAARQIAIGNNIIDLRAIAA
jgi:HD domain